MNSTNQQADTDRVVELRTVSSDQTAAIGRAVAGLVVPGDLIALYGELGAGKTVFVRGLAAGVGVDEAAVSSPTFVLVQEYDGDGGRLRILHVDLYRLETVADLESMGWESDVFDEAVVVVEWPQRLGDGLPSDRLEIQLTHEGTDARRVLITGHGRWANRMGALTKSVTGITNR